MKGLQSKSVRGKSHRFFLIILGTLSLVAILTTGAQAQKENDAQKGGQTTVTQSGGDASLLNADRDDILKNAEASADAAADKNKFDDRPVFHFHPKSQWMNDPNGPIYYNGWFHLFYQYNPYGDGDGPKYWAHARSRDLVNWQPLPIALWPSSSSGETGVWSGSAFLNDRGAPVIFYTSVSDKRDPEQWAAIPQDANLVKWKKYDGNPVISQKNNTDGKIDEWRDPFVFRYKNITYLITGGGIDGRGRVFIYQAANPDLLSWKYLGILFTDPDSDVRNIECPNFATIDGKWALLISVHGRVEWYTGQFNEDTHVFSTQKRGILDDGSYASQIAPDKKGRMIHFAWLQPPHEPGWAGTMALPAELHISDDWNLLSNPISELSSLRSKKIDVKSTTIDRMLDLSGLASGDLLEVQLDLSPGDASQVALKLRASSDFSRSMDIVYYPANKQLVIPGRSAFRVYGSGDDVKLDVFLDKTTVDLFADDGSLSLTGFATPESGDNGIGLSAQYPFGYKQPARIKSMTIYTLRPANFDMTADY